MCVCFLCMCVCVCVFVYVCLCLFVYVSSQLHYSSSHYKSLTQTTIQRLAIEWFGSNILARHVSGGTIELHLSGLIGMASHPDMQKIRIIGFFLKTGYIGSMNFGCYYLQYVPACESFDHA
jgi:hypothetical protein